MLAIGLFVVAHTAHDLGPLVLLFIPGGGAIWMGYESIKNSTYGWKNDDL